jgi:hypothetical protein
MMVAGVRNAGEPGAFERQGGGAGAGAGVTILYFKCFVRQIHTFVLWPYFNSYFIIKVNMCKKYMYTF